MSCIIGRQSVEENILLLSCGAHFGTGLGAV